MSTIITINLQSHFIEVKQTSPDGVNLVKLTHEIPVNGLKMWAYDDEDEETFKITELSFPIHEQVSVNLVDSKGNEFNSQVIG